MREYLIELGFQKYDLALLTLCPLGAVIGSLAHAILQLINPDKLPRPGAMRLLSYRDALGRVAWLSFRFLLGAILGLVIGLYFIGSLQENLTTLAKLVALSILLGYAAPKVWLTQETIVVDRALAMLKATLGQERHEGAPEDKSSNLPVERTH